jgi:hypothetical protein
VWCVGGCGVCVCVYLKVCDLETSKRGGPGPELGFCVTGTRKTNKYVVIKGSCVNALVIVTVTCFETFVSLDAFTCNRILRIEFPCNPSTLS